jgi:hypothetical protein
MPTPTLKNETLKVSQLIDDYRAGRLVIPEFQRAYVWRKNRAPKLIDSLYRSFPVSALLCWQGADSARERGSGPKPTFGRNMSWLIDGQQRVITLSRVMGGDDEIEVLFNPDTETFSLRNAAIRKDPRWVRVADLLDNAKYLQLMREIPASKKGAELQVKYERVRAIRDYEIPVVRMVDHRFNDAVDAFTRINTLATRLKQQDIESARVAETHAGLIADDVVPFMRSIESSGFTRLNVMHLFRVCGFLARPDGRTRTPLHELSRSEVEKAWKATKKATLDAETLVKAELGLVNMDILWSGALLVPVIALLGTTRRQGRDTKGMMGWLALAALRHRYSGSAESALDQDLIACRKEDPIGALLATLRREGRRTSLLAKPADFAGSLNDRGGLLAAYIACKNRGMQDLWTGENIILHDEIDRHHILPRRQFSESIRSSSDTIANIAFITSDVNVAISHTGPEVYLKEVKESYLESQCIPLDSSVWRIDQAEAFFTGRRKALAESFNEYLAASLPGRKL